MIGEILACIYPEISHEFTQRFLLVHERPLKNCISDLAEAANGGWQV